MRYKCFWVKQKLNFYLLSDHECLENCILHLWISMDFHTKNLNLKNLLENLHWVSVSAFLKHPHLWIRDPRWDSQVCIYRIPIWEFIPMLRRLGSSRFSQVQRWGVERLSEANLVELGRGGLFHLFSGENGTCNMMIFKQMGVMVFWKTHSLYQFVFLSVVAFLLLGILSKTGRCRM